jgi:hypothetical protein
MTKNDPAHFVVVFAARNGAPPDRYELRESDLRLVKARPDLYGGVEKLVAWMSKAKRGDTYTREKLVVVCTRKEQGE